MINSSDPIDSVSGVGDINGDGFDDIIIGSPSAQNQDGLSYVVFGKVGGFNANLNVSTLNGTNGFVINGVGLSGTSVSGAGDVNRDGFDDLLIGAPFANASGAGSSYVVFGQAGGFSSSFNLSTLNGTNGFRINGIDSLDLSGSSVSNAGDVNGDGFDDLLIGAGSYLRSKAGSSYVVFGKVEGFDANLNLSTLNGSNGFAINGIDLGDRSGYSVSGAGDVNGDGFDDLLIGSPDADPNGQYNAGESYVVFGKAGGFDASLDLSAVNGSNGFVINGGGGRSGISVS